MKKYIISFLLILIYVSHSSAQPADESSDNMTTKFKITKTEREWKQELTPEQFHVLREKGTEYAFSGEYYLNKKKGIYLCAACGNELFSSDTKYNSGSGWPSFYKPISQEHVMEVEDHSGGMVRIEVVCARCGGHLGHVFQDGPKPTGLRYCVNSVAMEFKEKGGEQ